MNALYGQYDHVMDAKNRVFVPAQFREALREEKKDYLMITGGVDECLYVFLPSKWDELIANNMEIFKSENKEEQRAFKRFFFSNAANCTVDGQGRLLIQQNHKNYAGLKKDLKIIGVGNKAEIWDAQAWSKYEKTQISKSVRKFSKILDI